MKKLFLTMAVALGAFSAASAQNNMWVGGTVGLWSDKVKGGDSELSFKVMPEFGYFLNDNVALGIAVGGSHTHGGIDFDGNAEGLKSSVNEYIVNPFVRYTFLKGELGGLFVDAGGNYTWGKGTNGGAKFNSWEVGFRPGVAFNVSQKVSLSGKFGFLGYQHAEAGQAEADSFGFDFDMRNVQLGISYKF